MVPSSESDVYNKTTRKNMTCYAVSPVAVQLIHNNPLLQTMTSNWHNIRKAIQLDEIDKKLQGTVLIKNTWNFIIKILLNKMSLTLITFKEWHYFIKIISFNRVIIIITFIFSFDRLIWNEIYVLTWYTQGSQIERM